MRGVLAILIAGFITVTISSCNCAAEEKVFSGTLRTKDDDADYDVIAVLKLKKNKGENEARVLNLYADGELARVLLRLAKDKSKATLTGVETEEGISVSSVTDSDGKRTAASPAAEPTPKKEGGTGFLDQAIGILEGRDGGKSIGELALSNDEVRAGLREALSKGIKSAISELGRLDGYFKNADVKIPVPENLQKVEKGLRLLQKDKVVDEFVLSMNRAAEKAVPDVVDIFADAIAGMSIDDAKSILRGKNDEATQYFKKTSEARLTERITPIVKNATDSVGVTSSYKKLMGKAGALADLLQQDKSALDLDAYVTRKALDGLFLMIAKEEKNIRENPAARTTELLRKIFGAQGK